MTPRQLAATCLLLALLAVPLPAPSDQAPDPPTPTPPDPPSPTPTATVPPDLSLHTMDCFYENRGQLDTDEPALYAYDGVRALLFSDSRVEITLDGDTWFTLDFPGSRQVPPVPSRQLERTLNLMDGNDRSAWHTGIRAYGELTYRNLYDGVDLVYRFADGSLKYDLLLSPGADPSVVAMHYSQGVRLELDGESGDLLVASGNATLRDSAPVAFQPEDGREVACHFRLDGENTVRFDVGDHDRRSSLVIDPSLNFSTYLGGRKRDVLWDHFVDEDGFVYVTGATYSNDFPTTSGVINDTSNGEDNMFVTKIDTENGTVVYSTFINSNRESSGFSIHVDSSGCAYVAGKNMGEDFPTTPGPYNTTKNGSSTIILLKLNANGTDLIFSSAVGSWHSTTPRDIVLAVDEKGYSYVAGRTSSTLPPINRTYTSPNDGKEDVVLFKMGPRGRTLVYTALLGGSEYDYPNDIEVDGSGNVIISGHTQSDDLPLKNAYDTTYGGYREGFLTVLNSLGTALLYSTYLGGKDSDKIRDMDLWGDEFMFLTGTTSSDDFPTTPGCFDDILNGSSNTFITKIHLSNWTIAECTLISGDNGSSGWAITACSSDIVVVVGGMGDDFPTTPWAISRTKIGSGDYHILKFDLNASRVMYSSYVGGTGSDENPHVATDRRGFVYVTGETTSLDFPTSPNAPYRTYAGGDNDIVVFRADIDGPELLVNRTPSVATTGDPFPFNVTASDVRGVRSVGLEYWFGEGGEHLVQGVNRVNTTEDNSTWALDITVPSNAAGPLYYVLKLQDNTGNFNITAPVRVPVVDDDLPSLVDTTGVDRVATGGTVNFSARATDNIGVSNVSVLYWFGDRAGEAVNASLLPGDVDAYGNGSYHNSSLTVPTYSLEPLRYVVTASDPSGNLRVLGQVNVTVFDDEAPRLGPDASDAAGTTGDVFVLQVNATDNVDVRRVRAVHWFASSPTRENRTMEAVDVTGLGNGTYRLEVTLPNGTVGELSYHFWAVDGSGNWCITAVASLPVTDDDPPAFLEDLSDEVATTGDLFRLRAAVWENVGLEEVVARVWYGDDFGAAEDLALELESREANGTWVYTFGELLVPGHVKGTLSYYLWAKDTAGATVRTANRTLEVVDDDPPVLVDLGYPERATTGDPQEFWMKVRENVGVEEASLVYWFGSDAPTTAEMERGPWAPGGIMRCHLDLLVPPDRTDDLHFLFRFSDEWGHQVETGERVIEVVDDDPPTIEEGAAPSEHPRGTDLEVSAAVEDNVGVLVVYALYRFGDGDEENATLEGGDGYSLTIDVPRDEAGPLRYRLLAWDVTGLSNGTPERTVELVNAAPELRYEGTWELVEGEPCELDLGPHVVDANDPPEALTLSTDAAWVTVEGLRLTARPEDWMPAGELEVRISDGDEETVWSVSFRVEDVNDAPVIAGVTSPLEGSDLDEGEAVELRVDWSDPDTVQGQVVTVTWSSDRQGQVAEWTSGDAGPHTVDDLEPGEHVLTVTVSDGEAQAEATVRVTVHGSGVTSGGTALAVLVVVLLTVIAVVIGYRYTRRR